MAGKLVWGFAMQSAKLQISCHASCCLLEPRWTGPKVFYTRQARHLGNQRRNSCSSFHCMATSAPAADLDASGPLHSQAHSSGKQRLTLYNSLTRSKETFKPQASDNSVSMYVCGVTVYDYSHIGHARVYTSFDVLYRYLLQLGYKVNYVRNFTDVDDKIINRAKETGTSPQDLSERFIREYHKDMESLNCLQPTLEPRATDYIQAIIRDIEQIISNGHGYEAGGDVFFNISTLENYGRLSGRKQDDNRAGSRVAVDSSKRNAADFVLWKAAKAGEPQWDSPWGPGRPGWHIECSAMIRDTMGPAIDIHGGGRDLIFPHHENELAQAQAAASQHDCERMHADHGFVRFWLHNGFVNIDSEKMSKSLGNFFTIRDVIQQYHPLTLRFFLISSQYRAPINYSQKGLNLAADRMYYIYQTLCDCRQALSGQGDLQQLEQQVEGGSAQAMLEQLHSGLADDLNTSPAISGLSEPLKLVNDLCHTKKGKKAEGRLKELASLWAGFRVVLDVLGLWKGDPHAVLQEMRALALHRSGLTEADVLAAIESRAEARKAKDFATADKVREDIAAKGIQIMDTPEGTTWRPNPSLDTADEMF